MTTPNAIYIINIHAQKNIVGPNFNHQPIQQILLTKNGPKIHINKQSPNLTMLGPKTRRIKKKKKVK